MCPSHYNQECLNLQSLKPGVVLVPPSPLTYNTFSIKAAEFNYLEYISEAVILLSRKSSVTLKAFCIKARPNPSFPLYLPTPKLKVS